MKQGLVGAWYQSPSLTRVAESVAIDRLETIWDEGYGNDWSVLYTGYLTGPVDGEVTFYGSSSKSLMVIVDGQSVVELFSGDGRSETTIAMVAGKRYPVQVAYFQTQASEEDFISVRWSWNQRELETIGGSFLGYTTEQAWYWGHIEQLSSDDFDLAHLGETEHTATHTFAYAQPGRFAGWPANHGFWSWGDEERFAYTLDKGKSWMGPCRINGLGFNPDDLTS